MPTADIFVLLVFSLVITTGPATAPSSQSAIKTRGNSTAKMFGGRLATNGEFPYMVHIFIRNIDFMMTPTDFCVNRCAGVIISPWRVVTACHCFSANGLVPKTIEMRAGSNYIGSVSKQEQFRSTNFYSIHPRCISRSVGYEFNIAVIQLRLDEPWVFTTVIQQMNVTGFVIEPFQKMIQEKLSKREKCLVPGWGRSMCAPEMLPDLYSQSQTTFIDILRVVEVRMIPASECEDVISKAVYRSPNRPPNVYYPVPGYKKFTDTGTICGKTVVFNEELASGDAGGPLVCSSKPIGIVTGAYIDTWEERNVITFANIRYARPWFSDQPLVQNTLPPPNITTTEQPATTAR